jgi:hypothetical protein
LSRSQPISSISTSSTGTNAIQAQG